MGPHSQIPSPHPQPTTGDMLLPILSLLLILIPLLVANLSFSHIRTLDTQVPSPAPAAQNTPSSKKVLYLTLAANEFKSEWVMEDSGSVIGVQSFLPSLLPLENLRKAIRPSEVSAILISVSPFLPYQTLISALEPFQKLKGVPIVLLPGEKR